MDRNLLINFLSHPATPILIGIMILMSPSSDEEIYGISTNTIKNIAAKSNFVDVLSRF